MIVFLLHHKARPDSKAKVSVVKGEDSTPLNFGGTNTKLLFELFSNIHLKPVLIKETLKAITNAVWMLFDSDKEKNEWYYAAVELLIYEQRVEWFETSEGYRLLEVLNQIHIDGNLLHGAFNAVKNLQLIFSLE